jgi:2-oxoisovalerate dehydrogenase E2 component (dihydrolipoyl transacylase)
MADPRQFRLPDVGEGLTEAEIVRWHVQPGDPVKVNQTIVEIETAKAIVELPSPWDGTVTSLLVPEGETVDVGTPIIAITEDGADAVPAGPADGTTQPAGAGPAGSAERPAALAEDLVPPAATSEQPDAAAGTNGAVPEERQAVLVGYGVKLGPTKRRTRKPGHASTSPTPGTSPAPRTPAVPAATPASGATPASTAAPASTGRVSVLAKPPVRKLAKDLGVDLATVTGTGADSVITRDDVHAAATGAFPAQPVVRSVPVHIREERIPIKGVRKYMAAAMTASAFTAPHVTEFLQIDITETMTATARLKQLPDFEGIRVSPLLLVAKALIIAVARNPIVNSHWDEAAQEIIVRHYVNLGIAAATDRGLVVPTVKDAHMLSLPQLGRAMGDLTATARAGKSTPADLSGGTITITNVGVFGVDTGTPIITPGETAILAFGQVKDTPWVVDGQLAVRKVCTLSLSFDHRIIDGAIGSAVLRDIGAMLTDPLHMLAWS